MTPEEKADALQAEHGPYIKKLKRAAADLGEIRGGDKSKRYIRLVQIADAAARLAHPYTPCRRGCSSCCNMALPLPRSEAERLAAASGKPMKHDTGLPATFAAVQLEFNVAHFKGKPCPFLVDSECSVYRARPIACRAHHVLNETADDCDIRTAALTPKFDFQWLDYILCEMTMDEDFADIREWFPT